jgi:hypothetical protein
LKSAVLDLANKPGECFQLSQEAKRLSEEFLSNKKIAFKITEFFEMVAPETSNGKRHY